MRKNKRKLNKSKIVRYVVFNDFRIRKANQFEKEFMKVDNFRYFSNLGKLKNFLLQRINHKTIILKLTKYIINNLKDKNL